MQKLKDLDQSIRYHNLQYEADAISLDSNLKKTFGKYLIFIGYDSSGLPYFEDEDSNRYFISQIIVPKGHVWKD